jgi:putative membrane protein
MSLATVLPTVNACLNALSFCLLLAGFISIRRGKRDLHRRLMVAAFVTSCVFLVSYLTRFALTGTTPYPGSGGMKALYLAILFTHMPLAAAVVPLSLRALWLAWKGEYAAHKRTTRWLYPIWSYVSVTGVVVYLMLYHGPVPPHPQAQQAADAAR